MSLFCELDHYMISLYQRQDWIDFGMNIHMTACCMKRKDETP